MKDAFASWCHGLSTPDLNAGAMLLPLLTAARLNDAASTPDFLSWVRGDVHDWAFISMHILIRRNGHVTVVSPNERIAVVPPQLAVNVLFCLL